MLPWQAQTRASPKAERNPQNKTKDMSFIIKSNASSAFAAREENQKEQAKLREISVSTAKIQTCPDMAAEKISTAQSAKETIARSQKYVLSDAATALSGQANSAHEAVLRLFA